MMAKILSEKRKEKFQGYLGTFIFFIFSGLTIIFAKEVKEGIIFGIRLSALSIIPAVFPFFVLSDLLLSSFGNTCSRMRTVFSKIFNISKTAFPTFIIGNLCGFPLGVKGAAKLYSDGMITKDECERLAGFVNNPSLAFVVSGVGLGMLGSLKYGIILYLFLIFSSVLTGILFRPKELKTMNRKENIEQSFNLNLSIKNAIYSSISVSAYIIFFSMLLSLASVIINNDVVLALFSSIMEVGNATKLLSSIPAFSPAITFSLIAFALGFSGLSVFMQGSSFLPSEVSRTKILLMKVIQGILSGAFAAVFYIIKAG